MSIPSDGPEPGTQDGATRHSRRPPARGSRNALLAAAAAVLVVAGVVLLGLAATRGPDLPPAPAAASSTSSGSGTPAPSASSSTGTPSGPSGTTSAASATSSSPPPAAALPAADPVRVVIPSIGVDASIVSLGLTASGALEVPKGPVPAGWFTGSPTPGSDGPAVLAGHVTYNGVRGVFFRLGALTPGAVVEVQRDHGATAVFTVTSVASYPKDSFPTGEVYGHTAGPELRLITCAGDYDPVHHYYPDNLVVSARLTGTAA